MVNIGRNRMICFVSIFLTSSPRHSNECLTSVDIEDSGAMFPYVFQTNRDPVVVIKKEGFLPSESIFTFGFLDLSLNSLHLK